MQTLKTAAIVILLMTVMYGAYVSMTTPPEPLPPEVGELLVESEGFAVDDGMAGSLEAMGIDDGTPAKPADGASGGLAGGPQPTGGDSGVTRSLSDGSVSGSTDAAGKAEGRAASSDALGGERLASRSQGVLPPISGDAVGVEIGSAGDYPSTGESFALPAPEDASASFESSIGKEFSGPRPTAEAQPAGRSLSDGGASAQGGSPENAQPGQPSGDADSSEPSQPNIGLANAIRSADEQYQADQPKEALATLSLFYDTPSLSESDRSQLLSRLDPLAREVIYSPDHLLEQPHRVRQNETLMEIAAEYEVPWQLLANINGVEDPITVLPGTDLKVVRGPFRADIDLTQQELTLFLGDLYAGRFPIQVGTDPAPEPGTYTVHEKQSEHTYYDQSGSPVPPGSPDNPYGSMWLDLGGQLCLHGSPSPSRPTDRGCISVADDHASDLHGILSQGSSVTIRR